MKLSNYILIGILVALLLGTLGSLITFISYDYEASNCNKVLDIKYQLPQQDTVYCVKILNAPIYSYYIPSLIGVWICSFFFVTMIICVIYAIKENI